ncbi:MAG: stage 0 sporulation family protein [Clostridia bacterium]|jgi:cell fate regulator YaaT (PSP1 superfamily)|nr:stage 0 sporulation family protein [Clostridia bacterium]
MVKMVAGIIFKKIGKIYYFDKGNIEVKVNDKVVVETARGLELGTVVLDNKEVTNEDIIKTLKPIIRIASEKDIKIYEENLAEAKDAMEIFKDKIKKYKLEMTPIDIEITFDKTKIIFNFVSEDRVDFRELVKELAAIFKRRIELRQIGVRDETKKIGGIGMCGKELCCKKHLREFHPVSIKMAKNQNLSLNPSKISGVCKRLMCCLQYEDETYKELNKRLPSVGDEVELKDGRIGRIQFINALREEAKVNVLEKGEVVDIVNVKIDEFKITKKIRKNKNKDVSKQEFKELKKLEDK